MSAGGASRFIKDKDAIRTAILSIREGFEICKRRGYDPKKEKSNLLYRLPLFISIPIAQRIYGHKSLQLMFDGHVTHSPNEIIRMIEDLVNDGKKYKVETNALHNLLSANKI